MRKLIVYLVLISIIAVFGQAKLDAGLDAYVSDYQADGYYAKVVVVNTGEMVLHDLKIKVDDREWEDLVATLNPKKGITWTRTLTPGLHNINVMTKEGVTLDSDVRLTGPAPSVSSESGGGSSSSPKTSSEAAPELARLEAFAKRKEEIKEQRFEEKKAEIKEKFGTDEIPQGESNDDNRIYLIMGLALLIIFLFLIGLYFKHEYDKSKERLYGK